MVAASERVGARSGGRSDTTDFLLVTQYYPPERGAAQVRLGAIVAQLVRAGLVVDVVTAVPNYPLGRRFDGWSLRSIQRAGDDSSRVVRVLVWASMGNGVGRMLNYASFGVMSVLGVLASRRSRWLLIEYPTLFGALPALLIGRVRRQRVAVIVADLWVDSIVETGTLSDGAVVGVLRRVERWMLRRADVVTAVTEGVRDALVAKGVDRARLAWLPNGADVPGPLGVDEAAALRDELGLDAGESLVLYAGTHGFVHGLDVVLDAADLLRDAPVRFLLVGGGSEKPELQRSARERGLTNVEFRDPVEPAEVTRLLGVSLAGLATVRSGDVYRTIRSAKMLPTMAAGRPVVYSADDEGSRLVADAGAGLVTPAGDAPALAAAVRQLLDDPAAADEMGAAGRAWVEEHGTWEQLVGRWLDSIDERPAAIAADVTREDEVSR